MHTFHLTGRFFTILGREVPAFSFLVFVSTLYVFLCNSSLTQRCDLCCILISHSSQNVIIKMLVTLKNSATAMPLLLTLGAHAQRGLQYLVCRSVRPRPSVFPSVTTTTHNEMAKKRYKWVQRYTGFIFNMAIFVKVPRSKFMA